MALSMALRKHREVVLAALHVMWLVWAMLCGAA